MQETINYTSSNSSMGIVVDIVPKLIIMKVVITNWLDLSQLPTETLLIIGYS